MPVLKQFKQVQTTRIVLPLFLMCIGIFFIISMIVIPDRRYLVPHSAEYYEMINNLSNLFSISLIPIWAGGILFWKNNKGTLLGQMGLIASFVLTVFWLSVLMYNSVIAI